MALFSPRSSSRNAVFDSQQAVEPNIMFILRIAGIRSRAILVCDNSCRLPETRNLTEQSEEQLKIRGLFLGVF